MYISQTLERDKLTANYSAVKTAGSTPRRVVGFGDYVEKEECAVNFSLCKKLFLAKQRVILLMNVNESNRENKNVDSKRSLSLGGR